jgi:hypothetical protein
MSVIRTEDLDPSHWDGKTYQRYLKVSHDLEIAVASINRTEVDKHQDRVMLNLIKRSLQAYEDTKIQGFQQHAGT